MSSVNQNEFKREQKRLLNEIINANKNGANIDENLVPKMPKRVTKKDIEDIKNKSANDLSNKETKRTREIKTDDLKTGRYINKLYEQKKKDKIKEYQKKYKIKKIEVTTSQNELVKPQKKKLTQKERSRNRSEAMKAYWEKKKKEEKIIEEVVPQGLTEEEEELFSISLSDRKKESNDGEAPINDSIVHRITSILSQLNKGIVSDGDIVYLSSRDDNTKFVLKKDGLVQETEITSLNLHSRFLSHVTDVKSTNSYNEYIDYLYENEESISNLRDTILGYNYVSEFGFSVNELTEILLEHPLTLAESIANEKFLPSSLDWSDI